MPELAAIYAIGVLACLALTGLFVLLWSRRRSSHRYRTLSENLKTAGIYWSENLDKLVPWDESFVEADRKASFKMITLTGGLMALMSWAGTLFLLIIMVSYRFLARSRLERELFASPLAQRAGMTVEEVRTQLAPFAASPHLQP